MKIDEPMVCIENYILRKDNKSLKICFMIMFSLFIVVVGMISLLIFSNNYLYNSMKFMNPSIGNKTTITLDGLDDDEKKEVNSWIGDLKENYIKIQGDIVITNNKSLVEEKCGELAVGCNWNNGRKIYVLIGGLEDEKEVLCHELLHSLISFVGYETEEWFVDDIAGYGVCYGN